MAPPTEKFLFEPLKNKGDFRVLRLYPASSQSELIHQEIHYESLCNASEYEAVSYTWGDQAFNQEVSAKRQDTTHHAKLSDDFAYASTKE